jgi:hypothetical protein
VIVLIGFAIWLASEKHQPPGCRNNCPYFGQPEVEQKRLRLRMQSLVAAVR